MTKLKDSIEQSHLDHIQDLSYRLQVAEMELAEANRKFNLDANHLTMMAYFYANANRWDLEKIGLIIEGKSGGTGWKRFSHNFDIFILKLDMEGREVLAKIIRDYVNGKLS